MNVRRGDSLPTIWPRPAHTKAKHDILVKYLQAWFGIMGNSPYDPKVGVFDGFAGPGVYAHDEPGSPVLVLEALLDHEHFSRWAGTEFVFLFNEQDPERYASLEKVVQGLPARWSPWPKNVQMSTENRTFSELAEQMLHGAKNGLIPLFAFIDPAGDYRFEDRLADQAVLFRDELDTGPLQDDLARHFAGRTVAIQEVVNYVIAETPYYSGQVKLKTLKPMQTAGRISSPNQRRTGQFPDGTLITFP